MVRGGKARVHCSGPQREVCHLHQAVQPQKDIPVFHYRLQEKCQGQGQFDFRLVRSIQHKKGGGRKLERFGVGERCNGSVL